MRMYFILSLVSLGLFHVTSLNQFQISKIVATTNQMKTAR